MLRSCPPEIDTLAMNCCLTSLLMSDIILRNLFVPCVRLSRIVNDCTTSSASIAPSLIMRTLTLVSLRENFERLAASTSPTGSPSSLLTSSKPIVPTLKTKSSFVHLLSSAECSSGPCEVTTSLEGSDFPSSLSVNRRAGSVVSFGSSACTS